MYKSNAKSKAIQRRAWRFMLNYYESSYEDLLKRLGKPSMNLKRTSKLCVKVQEKKRKKERTIIDLNPQLITICSKLNLFKLKEHRH